MTLQQAYVAGASVAFAKFAFDDFDAPDEPSLLHKMLPWAAAAGAGVLGYKALRRFNPSKIPELAKLQMAARDMPFEIAHDKPTKVMDYLFGTKTIPSQLSGETAANRYIGNKADRAILNYAPEHLSSVTGGVNINKGRLPSRLDDKLHFAQEMAKGMPGSIPDTHLLQDLLAQHGGDMDAVAKRFGGKGFVIKPRVGSMSKAENLITHKTPLSDPRLQHAIQNPDQYIAQQMIPIKREHRVHMVNNVPITASNRNLPHEGLRNFWNKHMGGGGGAFVPVVGDTRKNLQQFARDATKHLGSGENLHHALDVAELADGSFKLIESNPLPGTMANPVIARKLQRAVTGRWGRDVAALGGLGAAGLAGTGIHALSEDEHDQHAF